MELEIAGQSAFTMDDASALSPSSDYIGTMASSRSSTISSGSDGAASETVGGRHTPSSTSSSNGCKRRRVDLTAALLDREHPKHSLSERLGRSASAASVGMVGLGFEDFSICKVSRKRSAEYLMSPPLHRAAQSSARAASEPPLSSKHKLSPSPPIPSPLPDVLSPPTTPKTAMLSEVHGFPLETFVNIASFLGESDLVRISHVSRGCRVAVLGAPQLWHSCVTLNLASRYCQHKLETFIDRSGSLGIARLFIFLPQCRYWFNRRTQQYDCSRDDPYFNTKWIQTNILGIKAKCIAAGLGEVLRVLDILLLGYWDPTVLAMHVLWQNLDGWTNSVRRLNIETGVPKVTLGSATMLYLASWMPQLREFGFTANCQKVSGQPTALYLGGDLRPEEVYSHSVCQRLMEEAVKLRRVSFKRVFIHSVFPFPLCPALKVLALEKVSWGRMIYDLFRKAPALEVLIMDEFQLYQEPDGDLPTDQNTPMEVDEDWIKDYEDLDAATRPRNVSLSYLQEMHILNQSPHIWSVLGEGAMNPLIEMPSLKVLNCEYVDLSEEDQALCDLAEMAPSLRQLRLFFCAAAEEDLWECLKMLPCLEHLDLRGCADLTGHLISQLWLAVPHLRTLDVRLCPRINPHAVASLALAIRENTGGARRIERIGLDVPLRPEGIDGPGEGGFHNWWQAWQWLDFTHDLIDELGEKRRYCKDKDPVLPEYKPLLEKIQLGAPQYAESSAYQDVDDHLAIAESLQAHNIAVEPEPVIREQAAASVEVVDAVRDVQEAMEAEARAAAAYSGGVQGVLGDGAWQDDATMATLL